MLIEASPNLFLNPGHTGNIEIGTARQAGMAIVHASKAWYEMNIGNTLIGLTSRPDYNPEYFAAWRGRELYMNIIDTDNENNFSHALIDPAMTFMTSYYMKGDKVLIHCDMGMHRSATIAMLFLAYVGVLPPEFDKAEAQWQVMYPYFNKLHERGGETGIYKWVKAHWNDYV